MKFDFDSAAAKATNTQKNITDNASRSIENKTVRINISMSADTNAKFTEYSNKTGISKSALIQHWIHENCD